MRRVPDVFDCWFESGSMPHAQFHYPFENLDTFNPKKGKTFPADFIAEGLDQTRGWFYSLLVLSVGLFGTRAYNTVVVNGLILAEDGHKMSKRLRNYPDPLYMMDRYGADALRLYLLGSPVVRAEDLNFSEKGVHEVQNKIVARLKNVGAFYGLYSGNRCGALESAPKDNILDRWICIRLEETVSKVTYAMDRYLLDKAVRSLAPFVDDLSTWYIRRSRDRFRSEDGEGGRQALCTTRYVLHTFSRILAPFAPFVAEEIYQSVKEDGARESVHLENWPKQESRIPVWPNPLAFLHRLFGTHSDLQVLKEMQEVRDIVSRALEIRMAAGIKVRQPLRELKIKNSSKSLKASEELQQLIKDEVNVKGIVCDASIEEEIWLDTKITPSLEKEGYAREFIRQIQDLRKENGLTPDEKIVLTISADSNGTRLVKEFEPEIRRITGAAEVRFKSGDYGKELVLGDMTFKFTISNF